MCQSISTSESQEGEELETDCSQSVPSAASPVDSMSCQPLCELNRTATAIQCDHKEIGPSLAQNQVVVPVYWDGIDIGDDLSALQPTPAAAAEQSPESPPWFTDQGPPTTSKRARFVCCETSVLSLMDSEIDFVRGHSALNVTTHKIQRPDGGCLDIEQTTFPLPSAPALLSGLSTTVTTCDQSQDVPMLMLDWFGSNSKAKRRPGQVAANSSDSQIPMEPCMEKITTLLEDYEQYSRDEGGTNSDNVKGSNISEKHQRSSILETKEVVTCDAVAVKDNQPCPHSAEDIAVLCQFWISKTGPNKLNMESTGAVL